MTDPTAPAPGWYPDPAGAPAARWWDGGTWTEHTDPPLPPAAPAAIAPYGYAPPPVGAWRSPVDDRPYVANLADAVRVVLAKYAQFDGRATRSEYWYWALSVALAVIAVMALMIVPFLNVLVAVGYVGMGLAIIVPNIAVTVRRLRDAGLHWAWIFLVCVPVGGIVLIVLLCQPSKYA